MLSIEVAEFETELETLDPVKLFPLKEQPSKSWS